MGPYDNEVSFVITQLSSVKFVSAILPKAFETTALCSSHYGPSVRDWLQSHPFSMTDIHGVRMIDGSEEAVLAWVTVNFLQGKAKTDMSHSAVVMDLGGGSTQIVFGVPEDGGVTLKAHPEYYYQMAVKNETHYLYQHSYLGYGLVEARKKIKTIAPVNFPCFPHGHSEVVGSKTLVGTSGGWHKCKDLVVKIFDKTQTCPLKPCSFNGVHLPQMLTANNRPIVAFSYIYDRIICLGLTSPVTLAQVEAAGLALCRAESGDKRLAGNAEWCLDLVYIYSLLRYGYEIPADYPLTITKQVHGFEAGWTLGTAIQMLDDSAVSCPNVPPHVRQLH